MCFQCVYDVVNGIQCGDCGECLLVVGILECDCDQYGQVDECYCCEYYCGEIEEQYVYQVFFFFGKFDVYQFEVCLQKVDGGVDEVVQWFLIGWL